MLHRPRRDTTAERSKTPTPAPAPEYWIVDPWGLAIELLRLDREVGAYRSLGVFRGVSHLPSEVLPGVPYAVAELPG